MDKHKDLPLFLLDIDEDWTSESEVNFTALVDKPAIQRNFHYFNNKERFTLQEDRRIISGPFMIPDMPIYRFDAKVGEYYVQFTKETIYKIVKKWFGKNYQSNFNLMHDSDKPTEVVMFESFVVDSERGISPMKGYEDVPDGTWFGSVFVKDDEVWDRVKKGEFKGFSIEGTFTPSLSERRKEEALTQLLTEYGFK